MKPFRTRFKNVRIKRGWKPKVSLHALMRYIERVHGIDVQAIKDNMDNDAVRRAIVLGAHKVVLPGYILVIENGTIVTVLGKDMRTKEDSGKSRLRVVS